MKMYTIGFTKKNAERFFSLLKLNGVKTLVDVRLNNVSQLAGFAKRDDLKYFLSELCDIDYIHVPELAPTKGILDAYKHKEIDWDEYTVRFGHLLEEREANKILDTSLLDGACFLCSEHEPDQCHRRLVAEYLADNLDLEFKVEHLQ